ncbi:MAG: hypothetical protein ACOZEN_13065, partial [Thermodesulfobacteriota bacterium]
GTPTPFAEVSSPSAGLREGTAAAGRAQAIESATLADAGQTLASVGKDVYAFTKRIEEQEALTYVQSKRAAAEIEGTKAMGEWEGTVSGQDALKAPSDLQERLGKLKQSLLEDAPNDRARQYAEQDIDVRMAHFQVAGEKFARAKFKEHASAVQDQADQQLLRAAYFTRDPAQLQGVLDQGKAAYMAHGVNGIWISPADAEIAAGKFENKAVVAHIQGKLDDPKYARQAIAEIRGGVWADKLDVQQLVKLGNMADATEKHLIAESRRAQAEAKAALGERQDKLAYSIWEDIKANPEAARGKYDLKTISALVDSGKLRAGQAQHFYDMAQGTIRQSDPVVLNDASVLASKVLLGEMEPGEFKQYLRDNESRISGADKLRLTKELDGLLKQDPETRAVLARVDLLFENRTNPKETADARILAKDYITKRISEGIDREQALAEAQLKFEPGINEKPRSSYVAVVPNNADDMVPAYKSLYSDLSSGKIDKKKFTEEWGRLYLASKLAARRGELFSKIEHYKRVGK